MAYEHVPVMLKEILEYLQPKPGGIFFDGTLGGGGYTFALAHAVGPKGKVLATDMDRLAIDNATERAKQADLKNIVLVQDNFKNLRSVAAQNLPAGTKFDGIVFDLGLSSAQLADEQRGFSFQGDRPLDMAFGPNGNQPTTEIVNQYPLLELTRIFRDYGEEKWAYRIAQAIVAARRVASITTTGQLATIAESAVPKRFHHKIHPATRIFQALRIETNGELAALETVLPDAASLLKPFGRLVVVSFHSGEDRIVKRFLKGETGFKILTKRPLIPTEDETASNPRARSAKLRAAEKI